MKDEEREVKIAQAIRFIKKYKRNIRFIKMRLKIQSEPGYNPWKKPHKERQYRQSDIDAEMVKLNTVKAILFNV
jgi:hypothetical protein